NRQINNDLSVRISGMGHKSEIAGRDAIYNDRWGAAFALAYKPTDRMEIGFDYYHLTTDEMPDWGVPYDNANNRPFDVNRDNFYGIVDRVFRKTFADIYTLNGSYRVSDSLKLHGVVRYGQTGNAYVASAPERPDTSDADPANWTLRANAKRRDAVTNYWAGQFDATWDVKTGAFEHTIVFGLDASNERILNRRRATVECATLPCTGPTSSPTQNLFNPNPYQPWTVGDDGLTNRTRTSVDSFGLYAIDTIKFGEKWRVTAGLRRDSYDINYSDFNYNTAVGSERSNDVDFWNWHLGLVYKPKTNVSLYAAYGSSSNPSGEQLDSTSLDYGGLDARTEALKPERNKSYEVGVKWNAFDEHLALGAALFRIEKENARVALDASTVALVGEQRADGIELSASGNITKAWSMFGGVTFLDAKTTASPVAANIGAKFPNVPKTSFSLTSRYQVTEKGNLGATATYNSKRYGGTSVAQSTFIPDYWRVDLFGGYQVTDRVEVSFNVLNLTDELYYDALYRSST
ncbi:MAG: TonB-dependent receptor, partial [Planctomycetales bacterium]|nr:TonB-dependent receptor [Planctomycetales bacterium]